MFQRLLTSFSFSESFNASNVKWLRSLGDANVPTLVLQGVLGLMGRKVLCCWGCRLRSTPLPAEVTPGWSAYDMNNPTLQGETVMPKLRFLTSAEILLQKWKPVWSSSRHSIAGWHLVYLCTLLASFASENSFLLLVFLYFIAKFPTTFDLWGANRTNVWRGFLASTLPSAQCNI